MTEIQLEHDELVQRLRAVAARLELRGASDAFLASLSSASPRYRPVLAHLAYAKNFPAHEFEPSPEQQNYLCIVCGAKDLEKRTQHEILAALARGDSTVASPVGALLDLEDFEKLEPAVPTPDDVARFDGMLDVLARLPPKGRATDLVKQWGPLLPRSNKYSRAALVETLGVTGILETPDHPGHLTRWVGFWEYQEMPSLGGDMRPPEAWWQRSHGIHRAALDRVFPHAGLERGRFPETCEQRAIEPQAVKLPKKGPNPAKELSPGDVLGIEFRGAWIAGVVLGRHTEGKRSLPVIEFYQGSWTSAPTCAELASLPARAVGPFFDAPRWRREPLAMEELELFGPVMPARLEVLGRAAGPPDPRGLVLPTQSYRVIAARNLLYVLCTLRTSPLRGEA